MSGLHQSSLQTAYSDIYGLVLLKKKPEYGPATLKSRKLKLTNCTINDLIEKGSILYLNGRKIETY